MYEERRCGCPVCRNTRRPLLCPNCVNRGHLNDLALRTARRHKQKLLERINWALGVQRKKELQTAQQQQHAARLESLRKASQRSAEAEQELRKTLAEADQHRTSNRRRSRSLSEASEQLARRRLEQLVHVLPESIKQRKLHLHILLEQLNLARGHRLGALLEVLPLQIPALRHSSVDARGPGAGSGAQHPLSGKGRIPYVKLCGLRLPDTLTPGVDEPHEAQETGTVLGYLALFLRLAADYLGGPLLHTLGFQGSTSALWVPKSFWDAGPPTEAARHLLHVQHGNAPPGAGTSAASSSNAMPGLAVITQHWENIKQSAAGGNAATARPTRRQKEDLAMALRLLSRSAAALVAQQLGPAAQRLPTDWNPFASLAVVCMQMVASARPDMQRSRMTGGQNSMAGSMLMRAATVGPGQCLNPEAFLPEDEDMEMVDGWDMIQRPLIWHAGASAMSAAPGAQPFLPPPPSRPGDVHNWERAMFTDSNSAYLVTAPALAAAAAAAAVLPPVVLRQLLSPFSRRTH